MKTIHYKLYTNFYEVMNMEQIDFMKEAYGELYKIEISLRILIHEVMTEEYGPGWLIKAPVSMGYRPYQKPLSSFYYHELISFIVLPLFKTNISRRLHSSIKKYYIHSKQYSTL